MLLIVSICAIFVSETCSIDAITSLSFPSLKSRPWIFIPFSFMYFNSSLSSLSSLSNVATLLSLLLFAIINSIFSSWEFAGFLTWQVTSSYSVYPRSTSSFNALHRLSPEISLYSPSSDGAYITARFSINPMVNISPAFSSIPSCG